MKHNMKRMLSLLLALVAIVSLFTMPAAAASDTDNRATIITSQGRIKVKVAAGKWYTYPEGFEMPTIYTGEDWGWNHCVGLSQKFFRDIASRDACYDSYGVFDYAAYFKQKELKNAISLGWVSEMSWDNDMTRDAFACGKVAKPDGVDLINLAANAFLRDDIIRNIIVVGTGAKGIEGLNADNLAYIGPNAFKQSKLETILFTKDWIGTRETHGNAVENAETGEIIGYTNALFRNGMAFGKEALIIEEGAFSSCDNLTTVWFEAEPAALYLGPNAFANCPNLTIHAPAGGRIEAHCKAYGINFESTGETANPQPYAGEPGGTIPLPYERYGVTQLDLPNADGFPADNSAVKPGEGPGNTPTPPIVVTPDPQPTHVGNFTDVPTTAWYAPAVQWAAENSIVNGTSATTFTPDGQCTRAQIVQILYNQAGRPSVADIENKFVDVNDNAWYADAIKWASANGVVNGTSATTFDPEAPCTRAQVVQVLYNKNGRPDTSKLSNSFTDVSDAAWYAPAIKWAAANKVVNGTGNGQFSPEGICTRAQVVQILYNIAKA